MIFMLSSKKVGPEAGAMAASSSPEAALLAGGGNYGVSACLRLLMHLISEPCFDDLRTKQQLGYLVRKCSFW